MIFILLLFTHMKMKKMLIGAFLGIFAVAGIAVLPNYASADSGTDYWHRGNPNADANKLAGDSDEQKLTWAAFLDTIRNAINWILWILATIALVICLYGWFKMVTAAGDEKKYGEWLNVLKYAAIGLAIIGLSWMIVSVIFWFVGNLWWGKQTQWQEVKAVEGTQWGAEAWTMRAGGTTNNPQ